MNSGSALADAAIYLWIPFSLVLFYVLPPLRAALWTIFGALMFLPMNAGFGLPYMPLFTKDTLPYACVLIGCTLRCPKRVWKLPEERWVIVLTAALLACGIGTFLTNRDPLMYGTWRKIYIRGLTFTDGMFPVINEAVYTTVPFFVGAALVRERKDIEDLFSFLASAGLVYSVFALYEIRMSPQLHMKVFGYAQIAFDQMLREGGSYRPMVFMAHGLALALFFAVCLLAATALMIRLPRRRLFRLSGKMVVGGLALVLLLCRCVAAILYGLIVTVLILFASVKKQQRVAVFLGAVVMLYPVLRTFGLFPTETVLSGASLISEDRRGSLEFRFTNEDVLLEKARERPVFGWGQYNRNLVFNDGGRVATVTDGAWIIIVGVTGAVGFVTVFGLLVVPIWLTAGRLKRVKDPRDRRSLVALTLMVTITSLDLLPNGMFSNYPYFLAGALLSLSRGARYWQVTHVDYAAASAGYDPQASVEYAQRSS